MVVYVESTARDTERQLLGKLQSLSAAATGASSLSDLTASIRTNRALLEGQKVLLVLDQFEQWLHAIEDYENSELVQTLRQCDGVRVQCLLLVRDDFWMAITRFLHALEVRLAEQVNSGTIDLFPPRHARKVLAAFGRAYGALPTEGRALSKPQETFLSQAVEALAEDGHIICVRLALFAEMMKGKPWTPDTLQKTGGTEGVGVTFLEETFASSMAPPEHRYHQQPARRVLQALLPDSGTGIKGHMQRYEQLLKVSGYAHRPRDFEDLMRILDRELRLITPTDPDGATATPSDDSTATPQQKYYQLTHDYLVTPLRDWLTRKQRETRRGRAQLRLAELAARWNRKPENRLLPSVWEHATIRLLTRRREWSEIERGMMCKASLVHGMRIGMLALLLGVLAWTGWETIGTMRANAVVEQIATARAADIPGLVDELNGYRRWAGDPLRSTRPIRRSRQTAARTAGNVTRRCQPHRSGETGFIDRRTK